ncbi:MAG: hypothetical protein QME42_03185 [bacterium]|nr:hypothetical protein [bacterium]
MKKEIALVLGYLKNQHKVIEKLFKEIEEESPSTKEKTAYLGYLIHNLYSALEELFQEIAKTFENRIEDLARYHRELLKRMSIEIPMIRPGVLCEESFRLLDKLRGFRHLFRHAYDYELSPKKIEELKVELLEGWSKIKDDLRRFENFLQEKMD